MSKKLAKAFLWLHALALLAFVWWVAGATAVLACVGFVVWFSVFLIAVALANEGKANDGW